MNDASAAPAPPARTASASTFLATFASALVATALLLFLDLSLAQIDRRESDAHAASEYADGLTALAAGQPQQAADRFGAAIAIDRQNVNYALALGESLLEEGRVTDAEATLRALLDRAENDGAVNLTMAHVMERENQTAEAKAYFHRAIFGRWGADSIVRRTQARFELIDVLARNRAATELLAELLPLEETSPDSIVLRRRLGHLFILAGSPARAASVFRELLRRNPNDPDAYAGIGEAALALGNFRAARDDLAKASRLRPSDADITMRLAVADTLLALDPTARDIGSHERYVRSRELLARTMATLDVCSQPGGSARADSALAMLSKIPTRANEEGSIEGMLSLASDMWAARSPSCVPASKDTVLRLLHTRLVQ
jgi:predicted Zn-dependent protease